MIRLLRPIPRLSLPSFTVPEAPACEVAAMSWIFALGYAGFLVWSVGRARERAAEHAATGMLRSPLYWSGVGLIGVLVALTFAEPLRPGTGRRPDVGLACRARHHAGRDLLRAPRAEVALSDLASPVAGWVERSETHHLAAVAQCSTHRNPSRRTRHRYFAPANSVLVSWLPRKTSRPAASGNSDNTNRPVDVLPVASLTQPIR
ncbi:hypothetical protein ACVMB1_005178 [Bradyrhizobium sp. USDA 4504]